MILDVLLLLVLFLCLAVGLGTIVLGAWATLTGHRIEIRPARSPAEHRREHEPADDDRPDIDQGDEDREEPARALDDSGDGRALDGGGDDGLGMHADDARSRTGNDRGTGEGNASHAHLEPHEHLERTEPAPPGEDGLDPASGADPRSHRSAPATGAPGRDRLAGSDATGSAGSSAPPTGRSDHAGTEEPRPPTRPPDEPGPPEPA